MTRPPMPPWILRTNYKHTTTDTIIEIGIDSYRRVYFATSLGSEPDTQVSAVDLIAAMLESGVPRERILEIARAASNLDAQEVWKFMAVYNGWTAPEETPTVKEALVPKAESEHDQITIDLSIPPVPEGQHEQTK